MITQVRKRDGRVVDFSRANIESAIRKAARATNTTLDVITVSNYVIKTIEEKFNDQIPSVEQIQDVVEKTLVHFDYSDTAKAYIIYRKKKTEEREGLSLVNVNKLVEDYIEKKDWRVRENANAGYSVSGLAFHIAGDIIAKYSLNKYPKEIRNAHLSGAFHLHDLSLGLICQYCNGLSLEQLIIEGIDGVSGKTSSKPASHLSSVCSHMLNFLGTCQLEAAGAESYSSIDSLLAPFVKKDKLSYDQVKQNIQSLFFNLNVPSRWSLQAPFSNFTLDWTLPDDKKGDIPVIGGKEMPFTYDDCTEEMNMLNRAMMEVMIEGDKHSQIFSIHPDEKIIIRINGEQKIEKIGDFIDKRISSSEGIKKISGIEALSLNKNTLKNEFKPITHIIKHHEKNTLLEIKTKQGNKIKATKSHSMFKFENGRIIACEANKLKRGDLIVSVKKITPEFKDHVFKLKKTENLEETTLYETPELLWVVGFFSGNGCIIFDENKELKGISISSTKKDILELVENKLNAVFPAFHINKSNFSRSIISKQIALLFFEMFEKKHYAHEKFVPKFVFNSKNYNEYIDGLFTADGVKQLFKIRTVSKEMSETLPVLMKYNGFRCFKHKYKNACWKRPRYHLTFTKSKKSELFDLYPYIHDVCKEYGIDSRKYNQNLSQYRYISSSKLRERVADMNDDFGFEDTLIDKILHRDMSTEEIKSIKPIKYTGPVYDISVKDNESFVSDTSILLHNTFPIITFNIDNEFDWNGPNTDYLFEATAKYGPFYFANFMNSGLKKSDIRSMCCRLSLRLDELRNKMGGVFGSGDKTGSCGVVTINLAQLGYISKNENDLFERLNVLLNLARDSSEIKRHVITENMNKGLMPYTKCYLGSFRTYFSTIGIIGMNELLLNFMKVGIWDKDGRKLGLKIMDHIRSRLVEFQKETGNLYNLEATPAEGTTRRLANLDKKNYPSIIVANEENWKKGFPAYYSNSTSLPVDYTNDLFESLDIEEEFLTKYTGGCVKHIYLGERMPSAESAKNLVKKVCENYRIPYISLTPTFSCCKKHGYINGSHETCPKEV